DLHFESSYSDYRELQLKNEALQESEARYRELAKHLEQRVEQQVVLIRQQQRELYQSEKLAAVGQLAAGIAHEINNPIGFVKSNSTTARTYLNRLQATLQQLREKGVADVEALWQQQDLDFLFADFQDLLQESEHGISRVAAIIADLRAFSALDVAAVNTVDLNECVRISGELARTHVQAFGAIAYELQDLPRLTCQLASINQAIFQLVVNALQAIGQAGEVVIRTRHDGQRAYICVKDTGCGIPQPIQPRIFEPFFTTRPVGGGKGLGLSVCLDVAKAHGGVLTFTSREGEGSEFILALPLHNANVEPGPIGP